MSASPYDFVTGAVPAHRLENGAWIADSAFVAPDRIHRRGRDHPRVRDRA